MTARFIIVIFFVYFNIINCLPIDYNDENNQTSKMTFSVKEKETITLKCPINTAELKNENEGLIFYDSDDSQEETDDFERKKRENDKNSFLIVHWFKDSTRINKLTISSRYKLLSNNNNLRIKNVNMNDAGLYKCKKINGFGGNSIHSLNLIVESSNITTTGRNFITKSNIITSNDFSAPVFVSSDKFQPSSYRKEKGSELKLKCRANGWPKPEIMWLKNGNVLSEEEYGITRSKWTLDLKDLRFTDNGNFTCQIFNKYGYINSTFEVIVYEDSQAFEGLDPLNSTIISGMDAIFNCKIKSNEQPHIKWMKQISKQEYSNYVQQNDINLPLIPSSSSLKIHSNEDIVKNFYQKMSTQSPYVELKNFDSSIFSINDLLSSNENNNANEENDNDDDLKLFSLKKESKNTKINGIKRETNEDSVHYITLTSSPFIDQQMTYNKIEKYYVSKLMIKQASVKDTGIYVCFSDHFSKGSKTRKSFLRVLSSQYSPVTVNELKNQFNKLNSIEKSEQTINYQSIGILIIIVPLILIVLFSFISIYCLKRLNQNNREKKPKNILSFFKVLFSSVICCCNKNKKNGNDFESKKMSFNMRTNNSENGTTKSSLGSSLSTDSTSTTATTVAYYTTIPLLRDDNMSSPPKLPTSQPPHFQHSQLNQDEKLLERCTSTPSMAYYKIVDNEVIGINNSRQPIYFKPENDASTCISTNSRLYYQLTPMPMVHHIDYK